MVCALAGFDGWLDAAVREHMAAGDEDRDFWARVVGEMVEVSLCDVTVYATVVGETDAGEPVFWDVSATRFVSDESGAGQADIDATAEIIRAAHPSLVEAARKVAMWAAEAALRDAAESAWEG